MVISDVCTPTGSENEEQLINKIKDNKIKNINEIEYENIYKTINEECHYYNHLGHPSENINKIDYEKYYYKN
jgi:hypothetical protein